jgi:hypothetical protein
MAGYEIVERHAHAELAQRPEVGRALADVLHHGRLGDLELDASRRNPRLCDDRDGPSRELRIAQLYGRDVDRQRADWPVARVAAGLGDHPVAERLDQSDLLGHGDEHRWWDVADLRVLPADQRLDADDGAVRSRICRLVGDRELVVRLERGAQVLLGVLVARIGSSITAVNSLY